MNKDSRLPIKIVLYSQDDFHIPDRRGGPSKIFGKVTKKTREERVQQVKQVGEFFEDAFAEDPDIRAVARVILKKDALAKSHRPWHLFNDKTCPIIGGGTFRELYISISKEGLESLSDRILRDTTKVCAASISAISDIMPFTPEDTMGGTSLRDLANTIEARENRVRIRLFNHHSQIANILLHQKLKSIAHNLGSLDVRELPFYGRARVFRLSGVEPNHIEALSKFVGTQRIQTFPYFTLVKRACIPVDTLKPEVPRTPENNTKYPVVGIVDGGIDPTNPALLTWIENRESYIDPDDVDYDHGTFIAGLVVLGDYLNDDRFPCYPARIVDIAAAPKNGKLYEDELLAILDEVIPKYPQVRYWNLSMNTDQVEDGEFSYLAMALDELQDKYNVRFVVSTGNYRQPPLRGWPPEDLGEDDRILSPADSVRATVVGSLAHLEKPQSRVRVDDPSPFSRRGPGAAFLPKPEVTHYGGNCMDNLDYAQTGVRSLDGSGNIAEWMGTSFSTPLITATLASIDQALIDSVSPCLIKALLVQSAVLNASDLTSLELRYKGFGIPGDLTSVLSCSPSEATLIFEPELIQPTYVFKKYPFPIPPCMINDKGKVVGEITMTLVYDPPLNPNAGAEYCQVNVDASLGTCTLDRVSHPHEHSIQVWPQPSYPDLCTLYEKDQVRFGFKWSPVKVYRREMKRGVECNEWDLQVRMLTRSGFKPVSKLKVALVVTLRSRNTEDPVYDQVVAKMQNIGWVTQDLRVEERLRIRE